MSLILDLIFPKACFGCGKNGSYFCDQCSSKISLKFCDFKDDPILEGNLSIFKYHSIFKKAIKSLKYEFVTDLSNDLSELSVKHLQKEFPNLISYWQKNDFVLIPIPLHWSRLNWRGFNQSTLIGQKIAQNLNLKFMDNILIRTKNTQSQVKFKYKSDRFRNPQKSFCLDKNFSVPKNIILFDDVYTTGSTLNSAYQVFISEIDHCWFLTLAG